MFVTAGLPSTLSLISLNRTAREFTAFIIATPCSGLGKDILVIASWVSTYFLRASVSITGIGRAGMQQLHLQLHGFGWGGLFGHVTGFWLGVAQVDFGIDSGLVTPVVAVDEFLFGSVICWVGFSIFFSFITSDRSELDDEIEDIVDSFKELVQEWLRFNLFDAGGAFGICSEACWGSVFWIGLVGRDGRFLFFFELSFLPFGMRALFFVFSSVFFFEEVADDHFRRVCCSGFFCTFSLTHFIRFIVITNSIRNS